MWRSEEVSIMRTRDVLFLGICLASACIHAALENLMFSVASLLTVAVHLFALRYDRRHVDLLQHRDARPS
jgi:hypothetical protein